MTETSSRPALEALRQLNGVAIANAIETFGVRLRNEGFANTSIRCLTGGLPPAVGYAVTVRIRSSAPPPVGHSYHDRTDWWTHVLSVPPPRFVVAQDVDEPAGLGAFVGDVHANILAALGCVGYATNGSARDVRAIGAIPMQVFAKSTALSHAFAHIVEFGEPAVIGGLTIVNGDLLFGDDHGLQSVPEDLVDRLPEVAADQIAKERKVIAFCRSPQFSVETLRQLLRSLE